MAIFDKVNYIDVESVLDLAHFDGNLTTSQTELIAKLVLQTKQLQNHSSKSV